MSRLCSGVVVTVNTRKVVPTVLQKERFQDVRFDDKKDQRPLEVKVKNGNGLWIKIIPRRKGKTSVLRPFIVTSNVSSE